MARPYSLADPSTWPTLVTFDDVLLQPSLSSVRTRSDVLLNTQFTKNIQLHNPIVSSNMDTVTEADMCIEMARNGGIGVLHRFLSTEDQVKMVKLVKRAEAHVVSSPMCCPPSWSISQVREAQADLGIGSFLVVSGLDLEKEGDAGDISSEGVYEGVGLPLLGIITTRDVAFASGKEKVSEAMTPREKLVTADESVTSSDAKALLAKHKLEKLPLVDADFRVRGLITAKDILLKEHRPYASLDQNGQLLVAAAIGVKDGFLDRAKALAEAGCDALVVDIAHGHSTLGIEVTRQVKEALPHVQLIAGNVATAEGTRALIEAGADGVKVGIGPGSICITRRVTGCGTPQLSAIIACSIEADKHGVPIIADGGIKESGDITKAIAGGASTVMLGSLLAGTDESPGDTITKGGKKVKIIRGMAGYGANVGKTMRDVGRGGVQQRDPFDLVPEGVEAVVPYKGAVAGIIKNLVGGLKSGISYVGETRLEDMRGKGVFVRITGAGQRESTHHDVQVI